MQLNLWRAITTEPGMSLQQSSVPAWCECADGGSRQTGGSFYKKMCGKDRRTWCPGAGRTVPGGVSVLFDEVELNIMGSLFCFVSKCKNDVTGHVCVNNNKMI